MAKVFRAPIPAPNFNEFINRDNGFDAQPYTEAIEDYKNQLKARARKAHSGKEVGEIISFGVADGSAEYMVWNTRPFELIHIDTWDGYRIPEAHSRGLRLSDVRQQLKFAALLQEK